jgi:hypothetical protein
MDRWCFASHTTLVLQVSMRAVAWPVRLCDGRANRSARRTSNEYALSPAAAAVAASDSVDCRIAGSSRRQQRVGVGCVAAQQHVNGLARCTWATCGHPLQSVHPPDVPPCGAANLCGSSVNTRDAAASLYCSSINAAYAAAAAAHGAAASRVHARSHASAGVRECRQLRQDHRRRQCRQLAKHRRTQSREPWSSHPSTLARAGA